VAFAALPLGVLLTGLLYAHNEDGNVWNWGLCETQAPER
jgi:hypothetical protein